MSESMYFDMAGRPVTLDGLCRIEPEWAANRIRALGARAEAAERERDAARGERRAWEMEAHRLSAEVERLRARIEEYRAACAQKDEIVRGAVQTDQDAARYREALNTIRTYGQVCGEFETCAHPACKSSYSAWHVADSALNPKCEPLCWYPSCERSAMPDKDGCAEHASTEPPGPCPHGRDSWDRCDECGVYSSLREALAAYRERREAEPDPVAVALREARRMLGVYQNENAIRALIVAIEALAGRGK